MLSTNESPFALPFNFRPKGMILLGWILLVLCYCHMWLLLLLLLLLLLHDSLLRLLLQLLHDLDLVVMRDLTFRPLAVDHLLVELLMSTVILLPLVAPDYALLDELDLPVAVAVVTDDDDIVAAVVVDGRVRVGGGDDGGVGVGAGRRHAVDQVTTVDVVVHQAAKRHQHPMVSYRAFKVC